MTGASQCNLKTSHLCFKRLNQKVVCFIPVLTPYMFQSCAVLADGEWYEHWSGSGVDAQRARECIQLWQAPAQVCLTPRPRATLRRRPQHAAPAQPSHCHTAGGGAPPAHRGHQVYETQVHDPAQHPLGYQVLVKLRLRSRGRQDNLVNFGTGNLKWFKIELKENPKNI